MTTHRPYILPTPYGYRAACACAFLTAETKEILPMHLWATLHRKAEQRLDEIILSLDLIALEDL